MLHFPVPGKACVQRTVEASAAHLPDGSDKILKLGEGMPAHILVKRGQVVLGWRDNTVGDIYLVVSRLKAEALTPPRAHLLHDDPIHFELIV